MIRLGSVATVVSLLLVGISALAQDAPRAEAFGGYQIIRTHDNGNSFALNGWNASLSGFFNRYVGITTDLAGTYGTPKFTVPQVGRTDVDTRMYTFMFGPVVRFSNPTRLQPFAHALFGGAHLKANGGVGGVGGTTISQSDTGFAWALGGGVDFKALPLVGIRLGQIDYVRTNIGDTSQNNFRYSAGIVLRF